MHTIQYLYVYPSSEPNTTNKPRLARVPCRRREAVDLAVDLDARELLYLSLSIYIYTYISLYIYTHIISTYVYMCIYIYIHT